MRGDAGEVLDALNAWRKEEVFLWIYSGIGEGKTGGGGTTWLNLANQLRLGGTLITSIRSELHGDQCLQPEAERLRSVRGTLTNWVLIKVLDPQWTFFLRGAPRFTVTTITTKYQKRLDKFKIKF